MRRSAARSLAVVAGLTVAGLLVAPVAAYAGKPTRGGTTDKTAPSVSIGSPTSGATVSASFTVTGTASDNVSVSKVTVSLDGGAPTNASGASSWTWSSATAAAGGHTVSVTAYDSSNNTATTSVSFSVAAPADTTAPSVTITSPAAGSTVSGALQVAGTGSDNTGVTSVQVAVDGGGAVLASGTTSWSTSLDTSSWTAGSHTITARAVDAAGNSQTASVAVSIAAPSTTTTSGPDITLADPRATYPLQLVGRGRDAEWGSLSALLYLETYTMRKAAFFRDASTGATSYVDLPSPDSSGWSLTGYTMTSPSDLWVFGGGGPMVLRHYGLSGGTVPTSATLLSSQTFGDTDSRAGDVVRLASGALVAAWHQQGQTGPQGQWVAYVPSSGGTAQVLGPVTAGITKASKQVLAQHPVDGSVWLFSEADATGTVVTATFTESNGALSLRSTDGAFLNVTKYGDNGPDPENPDLAVAADPSTGTLSLAYQDANRVMFQTSPTTVTGSWVSIAHIPVSGSPTFTQLPVYVERISSLALVVQPGATWLAYRPIDTTTMTFDHLQWSVYRSGAWSSATTVGQLASSWERLSYGSTRSEVATRMSDGLLHLYTLA